MAITAALVKELRDRTGLGMMDCKKSLVESDGDVELAIENLRKASGLKAAKKADRTAAEGIVCARIAEDGSYGTLIEINSETDFVARDDSFLGFTQTILNAAYDAKKTDVAALMEGDLESTRAALVQKIGEKIDVRRIAGVAPAGGVVGSYVHSNMRIGVLVELKGGTVDLARDIAMHVAAVNPQVVNPSDVASDIVEKEKEIIKAQPDMEGKPEAIVEKMMGGRINKFLKEISLTEQSFVKDPEVTVGALAKKSDAEIISFTRFEVGEGIEKVEEDFAAEVAAQLEASKS